MVVPSYPEGKLGVAVRLKEDVQTAMCAVKQWETDGPRMEGGGYHSSTGITGMIAVVTSEQQCLGSHIPNQLMSCS